MTLLISEQETKPDVISIIFDKKTTMDKLGPFLFLLDRDTTGYTGEITDEWGDNPEDVDISPSIEGYTLEYGDTGIKAPNLTITLQRDNDRSLKDEWRLIFNRLAHYDLKARIIHAHRRRDKIIEWRPTWGAYSHGKTSQCTDFKDGVRELYGVDFGLWTDYRLAYQWLNYMFKAHFDNDIEQREFYAFTGSLGHSG